MVLKVKILSAEMRGGRDLEIKEAYEYCDDLIESELKRAFKEEGLTKAHIDVSEQGEGLNTFQLCQVHGELLSDYQHAGWNIETFPGEYLKFTFTPPLGFF